MCLTAVSSGFKLRSGSNTRESDVICPNWGVTSLFGSVPQMIRRAALFVAVMLCGAVPASAEPVTYARDVAPLLVRHCVVCHRPGGSSSVSLVTYRQARAHARQIAEVTASRVMPPWQPEPGWGTFQGERRLLPDEILVLRRWVDDGMPEGDAAEAPVVPETPIGWQLGVPDLVLTMPAFTVPAGGRDIFRNFVIAVPGVQMRYVRAWEFNQGNPAVVHHATMQVDSSGRSRQFDEEDPDAGYEGLIAPSARAPDGFFLDWAPGHRPATAVPGTAWPLPPGSDLVMMLHLRPAGRAESVQASLALYFADEPPAVTPVMLRLTDQTLDIPAGAQRYVASDSFVLPVDVDVYTVQPHAHYLARGMTGVATGPDGATVRLLRIAAWDFNWQDVYHYTKPIRLVAGTTLSMTITYDNTAANPRNPSDPPVPVTYGQQTSDEMAEMWFQVVPVKSSDRPRLVESMYRKLLPQEAAGRRTMLRRAPQSVALRDDLAMMLAELGDSAGAEREFREVLTLRPDSAAARFNVGLATLQQGRRAEAERYFLAALEAEPGHGMAHFQLGLVRQSDGDYKRAATHFDAALVARPGDAEVLLAAGVLDALQGERQRARARVSQAVELRPGWPNAEAALASLLAAQPDASRAERLAALALAERAAVATAHRNPAFLEILAETLAACEQWPRAISVARDVVALAERGGDAPTAARLRQRIATWERGR